MKNLESLIIPETKELRLGKLNEAIKVLKNEFVGLDDIIDSIKKSIIPWYITPEVIERPVVISLWGLTGTGKTSVVRRLVELLGLLGKTAFFDCGLEANESSSSNIAEKIEEVFGCDCDYDSFTSSGKLDKSVFVFDEFQYARTLDESGIELLKSPLRPIWNIIDNGKINISEYRYEVTSFNNFIEDFTEFAKEYPDIKLDKGKVTDREEVRVVLENLGLFYYGRDIKSVLYGEASESKPFPTASFSKHDKYDDDEDDEDIFRPLYVLEERHLRTLVKKLNGFKSRLGNQTIVDLDNAKTIIEYQEILSNAAKIITKPKELDCSNALVFILGNLDEAFRVESDLDPDVDADIFYDRTIKVSISDIKEALKKRFRAEQIARFGNNLIKYPALRKEHFIEIIKKELNRIFNKFYETEKIKVNYGSDIVELMYSEGVFPVQGVRPVYTTIGTLLTPLLSDVVIGRLPEDDIVTIKLNNIEDLSIRKLKIKETKLDIEFIVTNRTITVDIPLQLGELRNPRRRLTRFINSVHETGHAIIALYETGVYPTNIVSVSTGDGGFCITHNAKKEGEIESRGDIDSEVRINLGGYLAEELVYGNHPEKCLMGSGSDIQEAWNLFSGMVYTCGYFEPTMFANYESSSIPGNCGIPSGISDKTTVSHPYKSGSSSVQDMIIRRFKELTRETKVILENEKTLLREVSLYLGENGSMNSEEFKAFVKKFGNKLTEEYVQELNESNKDWYERVLRDFK